LINLCAVLYRKIGNVVYSSVIHHGFMLFICGNIKFKVAAYKME